MTTEGERPPAPARWEVLKVYETRITEGEAPGEVGLRFDCDLLLFGEERLDEWQPPERRRVSRIFPWDAAELVETCRKILEHIERERHPPSNP